MKNQEMFTVPAWHKESGAAFKSRRPEFKFFLMLFKAVKWKNKKERNTFSKKGLENEIKERRKEDFT